jgi:hypothetical protein
MPSPVGLSPQQQLVANLVYTACNLGTNLVTPLTTNYQLKRDCIPLAKRRELVQQEMIRQLVSATIFMATFGGGLLAGRWLGQGKSYRSLMAQGMGYVASFLGYAFLRPMATAGALSRWMYGGAQPHRDAGRPSQASNLPVSWHSRVLHDVLTRATDTITQSHVTDPAAMALAAAGAHEKHATRAFGAMVSPTLTVPIRFRWVNGQLNAIG